MGDARLEGVRRFTDRVHHYAKYRPDYPHEIVSHLRGRAGLRAPALVADVGSGTGKLAQLFLAAGDVVLGVEPNEAMRQAARRTLCGQARFHGTAGRAEALPLRDASVDAVVAGQAFHWFDVERARYEFARVLRPGGVVALVWNNRKEEASGFLAEYEALLQRLCPEYAKIGNRHYDEEELARLFGRPPHHARFDHAQKLDRDGLHGRLLSSSYVPAAGPALEHVLQAADDLFDRYAGDGRITIAYDTELFYAKFG
jgi:SAM-dependent methyltransferase